MVNRARRWDCPQRLRLSLRAQFGSGVVTALRSVAAHDTLPRAVESAKFEKALEAEGVRR